MTRVERMDALLSRMEVAVTRLEALVETTGAAQAASAASREKDEKMMEEAIRKISTRYDSEAQLA